MKSLRRYAPPNIALLSLAVVLTIGLALRWTTPSQAGDLRPRPDALEYEESARNWATGEGYCLIVDGEKYPPRYPFGFPAMLVPVLALADRGPGTGVLVVLATGAGAIASAWVLGWQVGGAAAATLAALLLALSPAHVRWSRGVMSDVPASCIVGWLAVGALLAARRSASVKAWSTLGLLTGLAATVRMTNAFLLFAAALLVPSGKGQLRRLAALALGAAAGIAPLFAWNAVRFGSPLADGYHLWVREYERFFSLALLSPPAGGGTAPNVYVYARAFAGFGDLYPWPVAALVALGLIETARRRGLGRLLLRAVIGFAVPLVILQTFFFWQDTRFLLPLLPLVCALAAVPIGRDEPVAVRAAALALAALAVGLLAGRPGTYPAPPQVFYEPAALADIAGRVEPNAAIIVQTNGAFFSRLVRTPGTDRVWVQLELDEHQFRTRWMRLKPLAPARSGATWINTDLAGPLDASTVETAIRRLLASGRPVYVSSLLDWEVPSLPQLFSVLQTRFRLEPIPVAAPWRLFRVRDGFH